MRLTVFGLLIFLTFALVGSVPLLLLGNTHLRCERRGDGSGGCDLVNGALLTGSRHRFALEDLQSAEFRRIPRRSRDGRFLASAALQVVLQTRKGVLPLGAPTLYSSATSYEATEKMMRDQVRRIEAFRTSSAAGTIHEGDDNTLMILFFLLTFGGAGAVAGLMLSQPV